MTTKRTQVGLHLDPEMIERVRKAAASAAIPMTAYMREAIEEKLSGAAVRQAKTRPSSAITSRPVGRIEPRPIGTGKPKPRKEATRPSLAQLYQEHCELEAQAQERQRARPERGANGRPILSNPFVLADELAPIITRQREIARTVKRYHRQENMRRRHQLHEDILRRPQTDEERTEYTWLMAVLRDRKARGKK